MHEAFAGRSDAFARPTLFAAALALGAAIPGATSAQAQGFFEALFGRSVYYSAPPPVHVAPGGWREEARQSRRQSSRVRNAPRAEIAKPGPYVAPEVMPGPLGRFLKDESLKRGDVVATAQGLMVFRGSSKSTHRASDFVPVAKANSLLAKRTRTELAKMDQVVRSAATNFDAVPIVTAAAPIVAQDESVTTR